MLFSCNWLGSNTALLMCQVHVPDVLIVSSQLLQQLKLDLQSQKSTIAQYRNVTEFGYNSQIYCNPKMKEICAEEREIE